MRPGQPSVLAGDATSPHLANLAFLPVDAELIALCRPESIVYTRFVDDLVFSSTRNFQNLVPTITQIIKDADFRIRNDEKTYYKIGGVEITGVVTKNNVLRAPQSKREKLRSLDPQSSSHAGLKQYIQHLDRAEWPPGLFTGPVLA